MNSLLGHIDILNETVCNAHGQAGKIWIQNLTATIEILQHHWSLQNIQPVTNMSWNYVAFAQQNKLFTVLKIGFDAKTIELEYQALLHFSGMGAIRVLDYHPVHNALLLQQAIPGCLLKDEHQTQSDEVITIYANVVKKLHRNQKPIYPFPHIKEWCKALDEITDPRIPSSYIEKVNTLRSWVFATMTDEYLCHGDLHLENVIKHDQQWLTIDPKGIIGEMAFEAAAFYLQNDNDNQEHRIQKLADALNLDNRRLTAWIFLRIMLSIQWFIEDKGDPTKMLNLAEKIFPLVQFSVY